MTREQYNIWRNDPATLFFRKFLRDFSEALIQESIEGWLNNSEAFERGRHGERARVVMLKEIAELEFGTIENFYRKDEDEYEADQPVLRAI